MCLHAEDVCSVRGMCSGEHDVMCAVSAAEPLPVECYFMRYIKSLLCYVWSDILGHKVLRLMNLW